MKRDESLPDSSSAVGQTADGFKLVEKARLDAVMRMLVDSGDMTPMAVRQIKRSLGIDPTVVELTDPMKGIKGP